MRPRIEFPEGTTERLEKILRQAKTSNEIKRIQCILLRARDDQDNTTIAKIVGYSEDSIKNIHSRFLKFGEACLMDKKKGGRFRAHMTKVMEEEILSSCEKEGTSGGILEISSIKKAYEKKLGFMVHETIIYRMLHAHGWRKITPRPQHPKHDVEAATQFKKNFQPLLKTNGKYLWIKEEISL